MQSESQLKIVENALLVLSELKERRENLNGYSEKELAESTLETYKTTYLHLVKIAKANNVKLIEYAKQTKNQSTWFKRKSSIIYHLKNELLSKLELLSIVSDPNDLDLVYKNIKMFTVGLKEADRATLVLKKEERSKRKSKKTQLLKLKFDGDWRFEILKRMPNYQLEIATLILTGCRPSELVNGVTWQLYGDQLLVKIAGVKLGKYSGQDSREILFDSRNAALDIIYNWVSSQGGEATVRTKSAVNLTTAIRSAGQRAFPKYKHSITAYSFRHQIAADMKSSSMDKNTISKVLGHASARTKAYYGLGRAGKGSVKHIKSVEASREIKPLSLSNANFFMRNNINKKNLDQSAKN